MVFETNALSFEDCHALCQSKHECLVFQWQNLCQGYGYGYDGLSDSFELEGAYMGMKSCGKIF